MGNDSIINELLRMRIQATQGPDPSKKNTLGAGPESEGFSKLLKEAVAEVNKLQIEAGEAISKLAVGEGEGIQETMIAMEKAGLSFKMMMQVRNKVLAAYQEIIRMQM